MEGLEDRITAASEERLLYQVAKHGQTLLTYVSRKDIQCSYPERRKRNSQRAPSVIRPQRSEVTLIQSSLVSNKISGVDSQQYLHHEEFPAAFFLAPEVFRAAHLELPRPRVPVLPFVAEQLGDLENIRGIAREYFHLVHPWVPIVSKRRFYQQLLNPLSQRRGELYMLAVAMKLASTPATELDQNLYHAAKQFLSAFDVAGILSIHVLHAALLISIYELGQAIYPTAYFSVGCCVRYATALAIDKDTRVTPNGMLADELEERRRTWWAILILDRFILMSDPSGAMVTEDPDEETFLPVEDEVFEAGTMTVVSAIRVRDNPGALKGRFGRLAQAVHLLSRTLRHLRRNPSTDPLCREEETQIRRTLFALLHLTSGETELRKMELCDQSAMCYSSILLLERFARRRRGLYGDVCGDETRSFSHETRVVLDAASKTVGRILQLEPTADGKDIINSMSIFAVHSAYHSALTYVTYRADMRSAEFDRNLTEWRHFLQLCSKRWRVARYGPRRAPPPVMPTDEVAPTHLFDDTATLRQYNLLWTFRFDDVLDPDVLGSSLSELFQMEGWRKLGGRLRLKANGKAEVHIPTPFTTDRPPLHFTKEHHAMGIAEHPEASKLPRAGLKPATFPAARQFTSLAFGPGAPRHIDDYFYSDLPLFSLHVVTFEDGTLVSINHSHAVTDLGGLMNILDAWQMVLAGKKAEVPQFMGFHDDPMAELYKSEPKEEYLLLERKLTGFGLIKFGLRLLLSSWWYPKPELRQICIPKQTMDNFLREARKQLPTVVDGSGSSRNDTFISEGDLVVALVNRAMAQTLPATSNRNMTTLLAVDPRTRVSSVFRKDAAYVGNSPSAVFVFGSSQKALDMPIGELALECRKAIAAQCTEEQMKAIAVLARDDMVKTGHIPMFGPSDSLLLVVSNWSKARFFDNLDLSPAIVKAADAGKTGRGKPGRPVFFHSGALETVDFASSLTTVVGRDLDGNFWLTAGFPSAAWPGLMDYLESFS